LKEEIGQIINKPKMLPHLVLKLLKFTHTRNKICLEKFCYWCSKEAFLRIVFGRPESFCTRLLCIVCVCVWGSVVGSVVSVCLLWSSSPWSSLAPQKLEWQNSLWVCVSVGYVLAMRWRWVGDTCVLAMSIGWLCYDFVVISQSVSHSVIAFSSEAWIAKQRNKEDDKRWRSPP
jgi:hypothetical protein